MFTKRDISLNMRTLRSLGFDGVPSFVCKTMYSLILKESKNQIQVFMNKLLKDTDVRHANDIENTISKQMENIEDILLSNKKWLSNLNTLSLREDLIPFSKWYDFCSSLKKEDIDDLTSSIGSIKIELISSIKKKLKSFESIKYLSPELLSEIKQFIINNLSNNIKYLGPLRTDPKSVYPIISHLNYESIDVKGENTAAVFHHSKFKTVINHKLINDTNGFEVIRVDEMLQDATIYWLKYLGVVDLVSSIDKGKFGYELKVNTTNSIEKSSLQDLTHVGVGVSQVLPIILQCLLSSRDDILAFEQPELHLHPKVQSRLTDFFICMALSGRQLLIETHSEYMINRLRLRIAESPDNMLLEKCNVLFVNKRDGDSKFEKINISKYGSIISWPDDFFDQSQNEIEQILMLGMKKKQQEKQ
ncbi:AAA family ATPase [Shewanella xiamenensis]|nr:DUF3696 domain-containing protein [Shewanella xiamenensis]